MARRPEHGFALAAVGLLGKLLGPFGLAVLIVRGDWPWQTLPLCIANDLVWWIPFALYLNDAWPHWRASWIRGRSI